MFIWHVFRDLASAWRFRASMQDFAGFQGFKVYGLYGSLPVWFFFSMFSYGVRDEAKLLGCVKSQTENVTSSVWIQFVPIPASHMWKMSSISPLGRFSQFMSFTLYEHKQTSKWKHEKIKTSFPNFPTARHWGGIPHHFRCGSQLHITTSWLHASDFLCLSKENLFLFTFICWLLRLTTQMATPMLLWIIER